jgi:muconolactone delta-isomerase
MTTPDHTVPRPFMVVATVRAGTDFAALAALMPAERSQIAALRAQGRLGAVHFSSARLTAFAEVTAIDEEQVGQTIATLPFSRFFDTDVYPVTPDDPDPVRDQAVGQRMVGA